MFKLIASLVLVLTSTWTYADVNADQCHKYTTVFTYAFKAAMDNNEYRDLSAQIDLLVSKGKVPEEASGFIKLVSYQAITAYRSGVKEKDIPAFTTAACKEYF